MAYEKGRGSGRGHNREDLPGRAAARPAPRKRVKEPRLLGKTLRVRLIAFACLVCIAFLAYRILYIKMTFGKDFEKKAIQQLANNGSTGQQEIVPNRGAIVDRNNERSLAIGIRTYAVFIDVKVLVTLDDEIQENSIKKLSEVINRPYNELYAYLAVTKEYDEEGKVIKITPEYNTPYLVIAKDIPREQAVKLEELNLRCVYLQEGTKRMYPEGDLAASTIGFTRGDASWGIELMYNSFLSGMPGRIFREFSDSGSVLPKRVEAVDGYTVVTTLDFHLQQKAEELTKKYGDSYKAKHASTIVMDPNTGEVVAMAAYPSFDLSAPADASKVTSAHKSAEWSELSSEEQLEKIMEVWKNYNISSTIEPGSIFKPLVVAAALEEGIITPESRFYCKGYKSVADYDIYCHKRTGHGNLSLTEALAQSCNVALMDIAEHMGRDVFYKYQRDFGFGEKTGIDLPGEENAESLVYSLANLNAAELATSSFGQRFNCTPIQIVDAFASIINGGNLMKPYVVSRVLDKDNNLVYENKPTITRKVISPETSEYMKNALIEVVKPTGTGRRAFIDGYSIGGKTGTAEQGRKDTPDYHYAVSMIGFLPADDPQYIVLTLIDYPDSYIEGSTSAAPMLGEMLKEIITYKNIQPGTDSESILALQSSTEMMTVPDLVGKDIKTAVSELNKQGFEYEFIGGAGTVVSEQYPAAGSKVSKLTVVFVKPADSGDAQLTAVPNVSGMNVHDAKNLLISSGFEPVIFYDEQLSSDSPITSASGGATDEDVSAGSDETLNYNVYLQTPEQGVKVPSGMQIKLKARYNTPPEKPSP